MANNSVETDSENIISLLLVDINRPIELEWKLFVTDGNKVSSFTPDSLESKFLAETNTDKMKGVDCMLPQPAAITLNKTRFEKQQVPAFISNKDSCWKSLDNLPPFTIKEIKQHRLNSGKTPESAIIKTLDKGRKFKCERYISADTLYTKWDNEYFYVKCDCKASMKKEKRRVTVKLNRRNRKVESGSCTYPAGNGAYCKHVMGLLFEIADYSLHQLSKVPEEISCRIRLRQWGVSGEKYTPKSSIMQTVVKNLPTKRGISSTFYDPRKTQALSVERLGKMQSKLRNINTRIGFLNCIPPVTIITKMRNTRHGQFIVCSALSFHLNPIEHTTKIKSNMVSIEKPLYKEHEYQVLPRFFIDEKVAVVPKNWELNSGEKNYLDSINIINDQFILLEQDTVGLKPGFH